MSGRCILVVEDELIVAENIRMMLASVGYTVPPPAASAPEALHMVENIHPDMVLIDIQLEETLDGVHLAQQIRERFDIPLVYLTAYADEKTVQQALASSPYGYLVKPFSAAELRTTVELAFLRYDLERQLIAREARYRTILDTMSELVLCLRPDGTITFANPVCARLLRRQDADLLGQNFLSFILPEDRTTVREQLGALSRKRPVSSGDARLETGEANPPRVWWHYTAVYGEQGNLIEIQAVGRDVSRRWQVEEELRERNAWLERLNQARQIFFSSLELEQVLMHILETLRQHMNVVASSVWLIDEQTGELVCHYATEPGKKAVLGWRLASGQGIAGWVASTGQSLLVSDVRRDPRHFKAVDEQTGLRVASMISVPLRIGERVIGVMEVMDRTPNRFTEADLRHVELLATAASLAIQNAHLYREANRLRLFNEQVVQSMDEGITVEDEAGIITFANPRLARMLRCEIADLLGRRWSDILVPEEAVLITAERHRWPHNVLGRYETTLLARDGERIPVMVSTRSLFRKHPTGRDELLDHPDGAQFAGTLSVFTDIRELKRSQLALQHRLAAEELLATISTRFLNVLPEQIDQEIEQALAALGRFVQADHVAMLLMADDGTTVSACHVWHPATTPKPPVITISSLESFPWFKEQVLRDEPVIITQVAKLPQEATSEKTFLQTAGVRSALWAPILRGGRVIALSSLYALHAERVWTSEDARLTKLVGEIILSALTRQRAAQQLEVSLREKEILLQEVQRRVNNNLQLICSLIELRMAALADAATLQVCAEILARVRSIGLIYEAFLHSGEPGFIDIAETLPTLVQQVYVAHPNVATDIAFQVHAEHAMLNLDAAVTLALLIHELLLSILTNAFPPEWRAQYRPFDKPAVTISLHHTTTPGELALELRHNGMGAWTTGAAWLASTAFSPQLIRILVTQLNGTLTVEEDGLLSVVKFPVARPNRQDATTLQDSAL